ncbi:hypothetical protein AC579_6244 [Pseudocercospora musae]|uniref:Uncharacterized protein n=1 Tax=Pseudocercospora musae TaxID=113226 RepID=A0A139IM24_9PEZI|nr:hypothetical protein AC579_6244 [Pseudocercospora musae]
MLPKNAATAKDEAKTHDQADGSAVVAEEVKEQVAQNGEKEQKSTQQNPPSNLKRKKGDDQEEDASAKAPCRSRRTAGSGRANPSKQQLLNYKRGNIKTYSFIHTERFRGADMRRHTIASQTIRTIPEPPVESQHGESNQRCWSPYDAQSYHMWDARTQHKDKTASQLSAVADLVLGSKNISKVLSDKDVNPDEALELLKKEIKGFGETSPKILLRRVQCIWPKAFPLVDNVSCKDLKALGLPEEAEPLNKFLREHWKSLATKHLKVDGG